MKKLLSFTAIVLTFSCSSDDDSANEVQNGTLSFNSYYVDKLSTGEERETAQTLALIHIWNADNKDFDFDKSKNDLVSGYVYDNVQKKSLKANYTYLDKWTLSNELKSGKYVMYVNYGQKTEGRATFSYSYKYFEIRKKEVTFLKKYLRKDGSYPAFNYHTW